METDMHRVIRTQELSDDHCQYFIYQVSAFFAPYALRHLLHNPVGGAGRSRSMKSMFPRRRRDADHERAEAQRRSSLAGP